MKCPKCGYNTVDWAETCKKCGTDLRPRVKRRNVYRSAPEAKDEGSSSYEKPMYCERPMKEEGEVKKISYIPTSFQPYEVEQSPSEESQQHKETQELHLQDKESGALEPPVHSPFLPPGHSGSSLEQAQDELLKESVQLEEPTFEESVELREEMISFNLAGIGSRAVAFIIDLIILIGITVIVLGFGISVVDISFDASSNMSELIWSFFGLFLLSSTYFIFLHGAGGKTIGKMICGIKVIKDDGESIGLWKAFVRWIGYFISSILYIGFVWAIFDSKSQAWHDKIAGTYVVNE